LCFLSSNLDVPMSRFLAWFFKLIFQVIEVVFDQLSGLRVPAFKKGIDHIVPVGSDAMDGIQSRRRQGDINRPVAVAGLRFVFVAALQFNSDRLRLLPIDKENIDDPLLLWVVVLRQGQQLIQYDLGNGIFGFMLQILKQIVIGLI